MPRPAPVTSTWVSARTGTHREPTARFWVRVWTWLVSRPRSLEGIRVAYYCEGAAPSWPPSAVDCGLARGDLVQGAIGATMAPCKR